VSRSIAVGKWREVKILLAGEGNPRGPQMGSYRGYTSRCRVP